MPDILIDAAVPTISEATVAHIGSLSAEQKSAMRSQFSKAYSPQEIERVFGPAPAATPRNVTVQGEAPNLSAEQRAQGYAALFKHAADKAAVVEAARRDGINMALDGKISAEPVAKESLAPAKPNAPAYKFDWSEISNLPLDDIRALDGELKVGFAAADMTEAEAQSAFGAIVETIRSVPTSESERAAYFKREGEALEAAYGERTRELIDLHSAWFKRLPSPVQERLAAKFALHSAAAILATANIEQAYRARKTK
jgi:hypothetical protein